MSRRSLAIMALVCAVLALLSMFAFDRSIALFVHASGVENAFLFVRGREFLDIFTGRGLMGSQVGLGQLALGVALILGGALWLVVPRTRSLARVLIFAGVVQLATIESAWLIKDYFGRLRPYQLIASGDWNHMWFAGGNSFPSGHNAFFWGLFLPLAYRFANYRIALLIVPIFIALARIDENYHFLSDVLGAITLAALITWIAATLTQRWIQSTPARSTGPA